MHTHGVERLIGVCWAVLALIALTGCRSAAVAFPDASDVMSPSDGTAEQSFADGASDSASGDGAVAEKRCGDDPNVYYGAYTIDDLAKFSDCTVLVGRFQEDSVRDLVDLAPLRNVRRIEGFLNIFRSPGFTTLHGLENLEEVQGDLFIHLNDNLASIAALSKLRTVTGNLFIHRNPMLPQAEVDGIGMGITVGGTKTLGPQVLE